MTFHFDVNLELQQLKAHWPLLLNRHSNATCNSLFFINRLLIIYPSFSFPFTRLLSLLHLRFIIIHFVHLYPMISHWRRHQSLIDMNLIGPSLIIHVKFMNRNLKIMTTLELLALTFLLYKIGENSFVI